LCCFCRSFDARIVKKLKWIPLKGLVGGFSLILLTLLLSKQYLGLGLDTILSCLHGKIFPWYTFIIKTVFTSITLSFGGSGGIITPIFFVGATAGSFFAHLFHLDPATFAAIGFLSLLAGAANTHIAASIMATGKDRFEVRLHKRIKQKAEGSAKFAPSASNTLQKIIYLPFWVVY
jgi:H+/Cl- antiporter ClcA